MHPNQDTAAICGLFCGTCPAYPNHCHGCLSNKLASHCVNCSHGFRDCAKNHQVTRCYECEAFPCTRLENFSHQHIENGISHHQRVISDLRLMKQQGVMPWVEEQTQAHTCPKCYQLILWFDQNTHICRP